MEPARHGDTQCKMVGGWREERRTGGNQGEAGGTAPLNCRAQTPSSQLPPAAADFFPPSTACLLSLQNRAQPACALPGASSCMGVTPPVLLLGIPCPPLPKSTVLVSYSHPEQLVSVPASAPAGTVTSPTHIERQVAGRRPGTQGSPDASLHQALPGRALPFPWSRVMTLEPGCALGNPGEWQPYQWCPLPGDARQFPAMPASAHKYSLNQ